MVAGGRITKIQPPGGMVIPRYAKPKEVGRIFKSRIIDEHMLAELIGYLYTMTQERDTNSKADVEAVTLR